MRSFQNAVGAWGVGRYLGRAANLGSYGRLNLVRTSTAELLGSELIADLGLGTGLVIGASYIPGEIYGTEIKIGELASYATATLTFESLVSSIGKKIAGLELAGALTKESGGLLDAVPVFRVAGKSADDLVGSGLKQIELNGEKLFVQSSVENAGDLSFVTRQGLDEFQDRISSVLAETDRMIATASMTDVAEQTNPRYLGSFDNFKINSGGVGRSSSSFLAGTLITLSNKSYINIENIKIGNEVSAFDIINNKIVSANVTAVFVRQVYGYKIIKYGENGLRELKVTSEHPFFVIENCSNFLSSKNSWINENFSCNRKWIKVKDLKIGDELLTSDGNKAKIISIKEINESVLVYNINVNEFNDYFANNVLVHNKPMDYNPDSLSWSSQPINLEYIKDFENGLREKSKLYKATLQDGSSQIVSVKDVNLKKLQDDIFRYGPQFEPIVFNKLDFYLTPDEIAKELQDQIKRLKDVNPNWVPYYVEDTTGSFGREIKIYSEVYTLENPQWARGEWKRMDFLTSADNEEEFIMNLKNSNTNIREKLTIQLEQLKQKSGSGLERAVAISDGHKGNIMVWIKRQNGVIQDIEIRPIDCYDPISLYPDHIREKQLEWVDDLVSKINSLFILIIVH